MAMMRKRRFRTFRRSRKPFRKGRFARQKFDKIVLYNNLNQELTDSVIDDDPITTGGCGPNIIVGCSQASGGAPCGPEPQANCCTNTATFELMKNIGGQVTVAGVPTFPEGVPGLRSLLGNVTLVRIYGDIWWRTLLGFPEGLTRCEANSLFNNQYARRYGETFWWGLKKLRLTDTPFSAVTGSDEGVQDFTNAWYGYDWTESHLLWQRRKFWAPIITRADVLMPFGAVAGVCSNTSGGANNIVPPIASGSQPGYFIDTSVSTTCSPQFLGGESCVKQFDVTTMREPPWHHLSVNIKKHITMRQDERLDLQMGIRHPAMPGNQTGWGCDTAQWPGENSNTNVFMRLAAVVRIN